MDATGTMDDGATFDGIREFKQHLMQKADLLARHFVSQLIVYSTGGEIQFADRDEVERIVRGTRSEGYPVRAIIHEVVQSRLFRNK